MRSPAAYAVSTMARSRSASAINAVRRTGSDAVAAAASCAETASRSASISSTSSTRGRRPRQPRRRDRAPRVTGRQPVPRRPAVERADRREPLRDRRAGTPRAEHGEVGAQVAPRRGPPVRRRARPARRGTRRSRSRRSAGCAATSRARRGSEGSGREPGWSQGRVRPRSRVRGRFGGTGPSGRRPRARPGRAATPAAALGGPAARGRPPAARRAGDRLRVRRSAGVADARHDRVGRRLDGRAALEAERRVALAGDRAVVGVVQATERLVVRGVVALRVARAAPEDAPGAPRATRRRGGRRCTSGRPPRTAADPAAADRPS